MDKKMKYLYSQNDEEEVILNIFGYRTGTLLDIGANDGKTLSNSLALIERGWKAMLVEPDPFAYKKMVALHKGNNSVLSANFAIGKQNGEQKFYSSGSHLSGEDTGLLSTLIESETHRWGSSTEFIETIVKVVDWNTFYDYSIHKKFDFVTIDAEGMDYDILTAIDFDKAATTAVCVEYNGIADMMRKMTEHMKQKYQFHLIHSTAENLIFAR